MGYSGAHVPLASTVATPFLACLEHATRSSRTLHANARAVLPQVYFFLILCTNVALGELGAALGLRTNTFIMPIAAMAALCTVHALAKVRPAAA